MKKQFAIFAVAFLITTWTTSQCAAQCTGRVFTLNLSFAGAIQDTDSNDNPSVEKIKATTQNILALALGQNPDYSVPANLVLAWVSYCDCDQPGRIIVWNTTTKQQVAVVATAAIGEYTEGSVGGLSVMLLDVKPAGGLNGGYLALSVKYSNGRDGCLSKVAASMSGLMNVTFTDDGGYSVDDLDVLVLKGKLALSAPAIGTIVD